MRDDTDDDIHVPYSTLDNGHVSAFLVRRLFPASPNLSTESTRRRQPVNLQWKDVQAEATDAFENQLRVSQAVHCLCCACDKHGQFFRGDTEGRIESSESLLENAEEWVHRRGGHRYLPPLIEG